MSNQFNSANYPKTEPSELIAGDRWAWKRTDLGADYDPDSYSLSYSLRLEGSAGSSSEEIEATASESGDDYIIEVPAATTAGYAPGIYHWPAYNNRSSDSERITVDSGTVEVKPDRAESTVDPRTHVKKVLDALEAVIEGRATKDQQSYTIEGVSLSRMPIADLLMFRDRYKTEYAMAKRAERIANGLGHSGNVFVRFKN